MRLASALITCTVTSPGQHFLAPTPRQQKAKTATTFVTRGEYFLQCHAFSPAQTCIFGGLLWSKFAILVIGVEPLALVANFGHRVAPLALVRNLDTHWRHLHLPRNEYYWVYQLVLNEASLGVPNLHHWYCHGFSASWESSIYDVSLPNTRIHTRKKPLKRLKRKDKGSLPAP